MTAGDCYKKWQNLLRTSTYKTCVDNKNKTGRGPIRFLFFDRMNEFLGSPPSNCSPHSLDVHKILEENEGIGENCVAESEIETTSISDRSDVTRNENNNKQNMSAKSRKRNATVEYIKVRTRYYEMKEEELKRKRRAEGEEQAGNNEFLRQKLQLEKRKGITGTHRIKKERTWKLTITSKCYLFYLSYYFSLYHLCL